MNSGTVPRVPAEVVAPPVFEDSWQEFIDALKRARGRSEPDRSGGLTLAQYYLLEALGGAEPLRIGELAANAGISKPVATRMITRLGQEGLVSRQADASDARAVRVSLTGAGRRALGTQRAYVEARRHELAEALDPEERRQASRLLLRLAAVIDEL
jgi:DNA-binding MarR family transcriptional regulator